MLKTAIWLTRRELARRKVAAAIAVCAMATAVAVCVVTEYTALMREVSVASKIDQMGPRLLVLPDGTNSTDLLRSNLGGTSLPATLVRQIELAVPGTISASEKRLLLTASIGDQTTVPLVGVERTKKNKHSSFLNLLDGGEVAIGDAIAKRVGLAAGDHMKLMGKDVVVAIVMPISDFENSDSVLMGLTQLQALAGLNSFYNALYLYPALGSQAVEVREKLLVGLPGYSVIAVTNDDEVRQDIEWGLNRNRKALYLVMGAVALVFIIVLSFLDTEERRREIATVVAIGGSARTVLWIIGSRAAFVGLAAGIVGSFAGAVVGVGLDAFEANGLVQSMGNLIVWPIAAVAVSLLGSLPAGLQAAFRDHVGEFRS